ncbi:MULTISPECIES: histidine kinase N-terminal 7TM domain-containing protein [Haloarcula]|uniref:sensor histidine kinase n=1 Tax=Haloarcula TaxID=2237 RepID=UPI0023E7EA2A|nr:histidine kinase N-terminal 7TM domain-containing protein [Halomicroarcula sp. SHR3]
MVGEAGLSVAIAVMMLAAALASYGFAWYSRRRAEHPISDRFALLMVADGSWALFLLLGHLSPTDSLALLSRTPMTASAVFATVFWFMFVIEYTGDSEWIPDVTEWLLAIAAAGYVVVFALNPGGIAYSSRGVASFGYLRVPYEVFGPFMIGYTLYTYVVLLFTFGLLGRFLLQTRNLYRKQAAVIFGVTFLVLVSTVVYVSGVSPHPRLDLTPVFFVLQAVGIGIALYRYDFLDVEPMAAHTLLEEMADPVFVVDSSDRLVDWNDAADAYVERDDGQTVLDDIAIPGLPRTLTVTDGGSGGDTSTVTTTRADGSRERVTFDVRTTPIEDRYDIVRGRAVVLRDVTEQEQRKRALETQNERLEEFTGMVSHDLRNPLQVIDSRIELARQTGDLSHLEDAGEATRRMEELLDDLLDLAREGQVLDETRELDLANCARRAWDSVDAPEATLSVETDRVVVADESRLRQVFENLFRNSIEHGGPEVTVTVGDADGGFYIADDGPGIPADQRDSVFDLGETSSADGTGFGLAIVERVVAAHGWSVSASEGESGGARFDVSLSERTLPALDE